MICPVCKSPINNWCISENHKFDGFWICFGFDKKYLYAVHELDFNNLWILADKSEFAKLISFPCENIIQLLLQNKPIEAAIKVNKLLNFR